MIRSKRERIRPSWLGRATALLLIYSGASARAETPPTFAPAATPAQSASDRADDLLRRGNALGNVARWSEAEPLFLQAFELKKTYQIARNLGLAEYALGKMTNAAEHLRYALERFPSDGKPENRTFLEKTFAMARAQTVALSIYTNEEGATISIDSKSIGVSPLTREVYVDPGARTIEARLPDRPVVQQHVKVAKGEAKSIQLQIPPVTSRIVASTRGDEKMLPPRRGPALLPIAVGAGLALAGLGTGAGLTIAANEQADDAEALRTEVRTSSTCYRPSTYVAAPCSSLRDALEAKDRLSNAAVGAFLTGGMLAIGTAAFAALEFVTPRKTIVKVAPAAGPRASGIIVAGWW